VLRSGEQRGDAELDALQAGEAAGGVRDGADRAGGGGAVTPAKAGAAAGGEALGRARAGTLAAMHAAAAVGHRRLPAATAATGPGAATRSGKVVAGRIAVLEPAAPLRRQAGRRGHGRPGGAPIRTLAADRIQALQRQCAQSNAVHRLARSLGQAAGTAAVRRRAAGLDAIERCVRRGGEAHRQDVGAGDLAAEGRDESGSLGGGRSKDGRGRRVGIDGGGRGGVQLRLSHGKKSPNRPGRIVYLERYLRSTKMRSA
jgi:hypothetical protein